MKKLVREDWRKWYHWNERIKRKKGHVSAKYLLMTRNCILTTQLFISRCKDPQVFCIFLHQGLEACKGINIFDSMIQGKREQYLLENSKIQGIQEPLLAEFVF